MGPTTAGYVDRLAGNLLKVARAKAGMSQRELAQAAGVAQSTIARIESGSVAVNDFDAFLAAHPRITLVALNGGTAARMFARHVAPWLPRQVASVALPSTSPAHAAMRLEEKLDAWRSAIAPCLQRP